MIRSSKLKVLALIGASSAIAMLGTQPVGSSSQATAAVVQAPVNLANACRAEVISGASGFPARVRIGKINDGPKFETGVSYIAAQGAIPAFCQVSGTFVTNEKTGKTANFLATFPENWNGKYLQLGCSGHCGNFAVSNPAVAISVITIQGSASLWNPNVPALDQSKPPLRTMPLCKFPEIARYKGAGDVKDGRNWSCSAQDKRMLQVGENGLRAGVLR